MVTMDIKEIWENIYREHEWGKYPPIPFVRFVARNFYNVNDRRKIKFLELGCGPGANIWYLAREGFSVSCIEISENAVIRLKKRLLEENLYHFLERVEIGDYRDVLTKFPDSYYDCVFDIESLCCITFNDALHVIEEAFKKLKVGGLFFTMTLADGTYGLENIHEIDYHAGIPTVGPLANKGLNRYTTIDDIYILFNKPYMKIEFIHRNDYYYDAINNKDAIKEWCIAVRKLW
ncbi:MAG: class I SAM-dependent methyltransferase [Candidatus Calescibacterium sp.]|jgi:SAM-dependent methyltransferase